MHADLDHNRQHEFRSRAPTSHGPARGRIQPPERSFRENARD